MERPIRKRILIYCALLAVAAAAALFEGLVAYLMLRGLDRSSPEFALSRLRAYYWDSPYRGMIQFDRACAVHDPELFYRLRPGSCVHRGLRFENAYAINSLGVRDDERSLLAPEIVSVGDSHAMGWGVEQEETYAQLLERALGKPVLNLGISSYGTARELTLLGRTDLRRLKRLIIQYDDNDLEENLKFLRNGGALKVRDGAEWERIAEHEGRRRYRPGAHLAGLARSALRRPRPGENKPFDARAHAEAFLAVLAAFDGPELRKARLTVFDVRNDARGEPPEEASFARALASAASRSKRFAGRLDILDLGPELSRPERRHLIDNHLNAEGHRLVAERLLAAYQ